MTRWTGVKTGTEARAETGATPRVRATDGTEPRAKLGPTLVRVSNWAGIEPGAKAEVKTGARTEKVPRLKLGLGLKPGMIPWLKLGYN